MNTSTIPEKVKISNIISQESISCHENSGFNDFSQDQIKTSQEGPAQTFPALLSGIQSDLIINRKKIEDGNLG